MDQSKIKNLNKYRWFIWGLLAFAYIIVFFHRFAAEVVKDDLITDLALSEVGFASLSAMYIYAYMFMQIPVGFFGAAVIPTFVGNTLAGGHDAVAYNTAF